MWKSLFRIGVIGSLVSAICCATPVLGIALAAMGLTLAFSLDLIVIPALIAFFCLTVVAWIKVGKTSS